MLDRRRIETFLAIPKKANVVLQILSFLILCIGLRLCYLTICQHENKSKQMRSSLQKVLFEPALRGTIQDRFGITLARNEVEFQVSIVWSEIVQQVPRWAFVESAEGKTRIPLRKKYVQAFASMLAKELQLDPKRIEDVIYSYAVFSHALPVPIKSGLSEKQFYRLHAKARLWPGLVAERVSKRVYPRGCSACHVIGYTAPLGREEYDSIVSEIHTLRAFVKAKEIGEEREPPLGITSYFHAKERLAHLERCGYGMFDSIGKAGVEASFDEQLRGSRGFKKYLVNSRGDTIALAASSSRSLSGKRVILTLSAELQEYAEKLLLETESARTLWQKKESNQAYPFFRGGAIVALDPQTKEILALASTPRFDPNDCSKKRDTAVLFKQRHQPPIQWIRNDLYAESLWNLVMPLSYEKMDPPIDVGHITQEETWLEWNRFLSLLCPTSSFLQTELNEKRKVKEILEFQYDLLSCSAGLHISPKQLLERLYSEKLVSHEESGIERLRIKIEKAKYLKELFLFFDIGRLLLRVENLSPSLSKRCGLYTLQEMRYAASAQAYLLSLFEEKAFAEFQKGPFQKWRDFQERQFLAEKRKEEETLKKAGKPYLQYVDAECHRQFDEWWPQVRFLLVQAAAGLLPSEQLDQPLQECLRHCLNRLLQESPFHLRTKCFSFLSMVRAFAQDGLAKDFIQNLQTYKEENFELLGSYRMGGSNQTITTGRQLISSIFMLTPPPTLSLAFSLVSAPGSIFKLITGYAVLQQQAEKLEEGASLSPKVFVFHDQVFKQGGKVYVGFDSNKKPLPQLYKGGRLPKSLTSNIGQVDMIGAIEASSNSYFSLIADEKLRSPNDVLVAARSFGFGEKTGICLPFEARGHVPEDLSKDKTSLYTTAIGQHTLLATPLQSAVMLSTLTTDGSVFVPKIIKMVLGKERKVQRSLSLNAKTCDKELLKSVGIDVPLFLEHLSLESPYKMFIPSPKCKRKIALHPDVQSILMKGMEGVIHRMKKTQSALFLDFSYDSAIVRAFVRNENMIGKSATAESLETVGLVIGRPPFLYNHTWFGAVFFDDKERKKPSLVVVVFLRYGKLGRQVTPLAAALYEEWKRLLLIHK